MGREEIGRAEACERPSRLEKIEPFGTLWSRRTCEMKLVTQTTSIVFSCRSATLNRSFGCNGLREAHNNLLCRPSI